ncbi:MAG: Tad domain-containing protein [Hyphomonadaceae bacterium]
MINRVYKNESGGMMLPIALMLPVVILLLGSSIDMMRITALERDLQAVADGGALYAAGELAISSDDAARVEAVAISYVTNTVSSEDAIIQAKADTQLQTVKVSISAEPVTYFMNPFDMVKRVEVYAEAQLAGSAGNLCLIALTATKPSAIEINNKAKLTAENCAIYSNSTSELSLRVNPTAEVLVDQVVLAGGFKGNIDGLSSEPVTDAPQIDDPLAGRQAPNSMGCDFHDYVIDADTGDSDIVPGVYCGGLTIDSAMVAAESGEYVMKNGRLSVLNQGGLYGDGVGFYFTGTNAKLDFAAESNIGLSAPRTGVMTGLLFFSDINNPLAKEVGLGAGLMDGHVIRSDNARRLVGTIYLPDDKLVVDGDTPVADLSEYTVIVAKSFELNNGPNLILQTDYASSNVPVPDGVGAEAVGETYVRIVN